MRTRRFSRYLDLVEDARTRIREFSVGEVKERLDRGDPFYLIDVREEGEWARGSIPGARFLGKGVIERDIEGAVPDLESDIVLYCAGGHRSALAADSLRQMGYTAVSSMSGGIGEWMRAGYPIDFP